MTYGSLQPESSGKSADASREVRYEFAQNLADTLAAHSISILVSTYQAGKLMVVSADDGQLELSFHNFDRPMGIAIDAVLNQLAVATRDKIWFAQNEYAFARQLPHPAGTCFLTRRSHMPESSIEILGHSVGGVTYRHYAHRVRWRSKRLRRYPNRPHLMDWFGDSTVNVLAADESSNKLSRSNRSAEVCDPMAHLSKFRIHAKLSGWSNFRAQGECEIAGGRFHLRVQTKRNMSRPMS